MFNSTKMTETVPDSCGFPNLMIPKACFKPTDSKLCCLVLHAHQYSSKIATDMKENLYVDNLISGQPTENDVTHYYKSARSIMSSVTSTFELGHPTVHNFRASVYKKELLILKLLLMFSASSGIR